MYYIYMNVLCFLSVITHAIKYWYFCNKYFQWNIYSHKIFHQIFIFSRAFLEYIHHEHSPRFSPLSVNENVDPFLAWVSQCWQVKKWFTLISLLPESTFLKIVLGFFPFFKNCCLDSKHQVSTFRHLSYLYNIFWIFSPDLTTLHHSSMTWGSR